MGRVDRSRRRRITHHVTRGALEHWLQLAGIASSFSGSEDPALQARCRQAHKRLTDTLARALKAPPGVPYDPGGWVIDGGK